MTYTRHPMPDRDSIAVCSLDPCREDIRRSEGGQRSRVPVSSSTRDKKEFLAKQLSLFIFISTETQTNCEHKSIEGEGLKQIKAGLESFYTTSWGADF